MIVTLWRRRGSPPPHAQTDLPRRRPVWSALSELYLDTALDESDHERLCVVLAESGYPLDQLEEILYRELHPVLLYNLMSVAGEWSGFDVQWLEARILRRKPSRLPFALLLGRGLVHADWLVLRRKLEARGLAEGRRE